MFIKCLQIKCTFCLDETLPKGTVLVECGKMLEKGGYVIKSLNTINFRKSMHYNPFSYIRSEKDILKLVNTIIVNTKGDGDKSGEDFWVKAEKLYYTAPVSYTHLDVYKRQGQLYLSDCRIAVEAGGALLGEEPQHVSGWVDLQGREAE